MSSQGNIGKGETALAPASNILNVKTLGAIAELRKVQVGFAMLNSGYLSQISEEQFSRFMEYLD